MSSVFSSPTLQIELKGALDIGAISSLHKFINRIPSGGKYLEIGSGSTPIGLFLPSRKFSDITACDKSIKNVELLKRWLNKSRCLHPHSVRILKLVAQLEAASSSCCRVGNKKLDENNAIISQEIIEERTRKNVKKIILGDILKENITNNDNNEKIEKYDAIALQFVLLTACKSKSDLEMAFRNLFNKLKPKGNLHVYGVYDSDSLTVGGTSYYYMKTDVEDVEEAARKAGFSKIIFSLDESMKEFCLESVRQK